MYVYTRTNLRSWTDATGCLCSTAKMLLADWGPLAQRPFRLPETGSGGGGVDRVRLKVVSIG